MLPEEFARYIKSKEFKALLSKYEQNKEVAGTEYFDSDDLLDIAEYYHLKDRMDDAMDAVQYCLDLFPDNSKALVFLARAAILSGDVERARMITDSIDGDDEELDVVYLKAEIMLIDGLHDKANEFVTGYYEDFDEDDDRREDIMLDFPLLLEDYGAMDYVDGWLKKAEEAGLSKYVDHVEAKARLLTSRNQFKEAIPLWNTYIDSDAFSVQAWLMLCQCQYQIGLCHEAVHSAEYALAIEPRNPDALLASANAYFATGDDDKAIEQFELYLDVIPGDCQGELLLSTAYFVKEDYEEARKHIENAIDALRRDGDEEIPDYVYQEVYRQAAFVYGANHDVDQAMHYLDYLLFYGVAEANIELLKASVMLEVGDQQKAFEIFNRMLANKKYDIEVYLQIGMMLVDTCVFDTGYEILSKVMEIASNSGVTMTKGYDRLAYAAFMTDKYDEFLAALRLSIEHLPIETVTIFSVYFPKDMPITEYYEFARTHKLEKK